MLTIDTINIIIIAAAVAAAAIKLLLLLIGLSELKQKKNNKVKYIYCRQMTRWSN